MGQHLRDRRGGGQRHHPPPPSRRPVARLRRQRSPAAGLGGHITAWKVTKAPPTEQPSESAAVCVDTELVTSDPAAGRDRVRSVPSKRRMAGSAHVPLGNAMGRPRAATPVPSDDPTICFTLPSWMSMHGRKRHFGRPASAPPSAIRGTPASVGRARDPCPVCRHVSWRRLDPHRYRPSHTLPNELLVGASAGSPRRPAGASSPARLRACGCRL